MIHTRGSAALFDSHPQPSARTPDSDKVTTLVPAILARAIERRDGMLGSHLAVLAAGSICFWP